MTLGKILNCFSFLLTIVKIEQEAAHVLVVNFSSAVCFVLRNDLKQENKDING